MKRAFVKALLMLLALMLPAAACAPGAGQRMRVLAETEDGWLHVFLPREDLDGSLNQPGTYGYLRREDVALWLGPDAYFP